MQAFRVAPTGIPYTDPPVDPADVVTIGIGWQHDLPAGVTLASAVWSVVAPVTKSGEQVNSADFTDTDGIVHPAGTLCIVRLAGFSAGATHRATVHVVWSDGQERDRSIDLVARER